MFRPAVDTLLGPAIRSYSAGHIADLLGFWMLWQLNGGYQGFLDLGMSRSAIYRKRSTAGECFGLRLEDVDFERRKTHVRQ